MLSGDLGFFINDEHEIDLKLLNRDLVTDDGLRTSVIISLYSDRRVTDDELPIEENSKRGWWGDLFSEVDGDQIGSRLWLLAREKRVQETLNRAEDYTKEALTWLIDDGVAASIDVSASYDSSGNMILGITITKPANAGVFRFQSKWDFEEAQGS